MATRRQARVMLLERNAALREIVSEALTDLGFDVVAVEARRQALDELLEEPDPDLLIVDLVDDAGGGEALLEFVTDQPELASIPLVVMTDGGEPPGAASYAVPLVKPFDADALVAAVREAMGRRVEVPGPELHDHPGT